MRKAPVSDTIIVAIAKLVDDALSETREPSHSDLEFQITRAGLTSCDPKNQGQLVGKAKRIRSTLYAGVESNPSGCETLIAGLVSTIRGFGGFRPDSPNFVGTEVIATAAEAFREEGFQLSSSGELHPIVLDKLAGAERTDALMAYVRRARRGADEAALVTGTGKDLLEATAAHVLAEKGWQYNPTINFPALLGQAFVALGLATPQDPKKPGESAQSDVERAMYELGRAINRLRNKEGTGHGRPWLPTVTPEEARIAVECMGAISERMLVALKDKLA